MQRKSLILLMAVLTGMIAGAHAAWSSTTAEDVLAAMGFSAAEKQRILAGEMISGDVRAVSERDLSLTLAFIVKAPPDELVALAACAAEYDGLYISHIRNEGAHILDALDEMIAVAVQARIRAEIYHLKVSGRDNWNKLDAEIQFFQSLFYFFCVLYCFAFYL